MRNSRKPIVFVVVAPLAAPFLLYVAVTALSFGCAARRIAKDYIFGVTGIVTTQDGAPIQGAEVTLEVNGSVWEGVNLVRSRRVETNDTGGFVFAYITDELGAKYTVTVRKEGFEPQNVSGAAPPTGSHTIKLEKVGGSNAVGNSLPVGATR